MSNLPTESIPSTFESRKSKILAELSIPDAEYSDLSPKGSVDEGIRDLIHDINALPGLVTTSSCAGRISVFLEGRKKEQNTTDERQRQYAPSGGKGAGKWLYVSHDRVEEKATMHEQFGMVAGNGKLNNHGKAPRMVRFHYDPMILHIMTATLQHAQPVLAAASSSGFRESGLQSLRCLDGDENGPSPIIAVRSAGLSLESIIGYCEESEEDDGEEIIRSLVTEEYLQMLVSISNERFAINTERKTRFRTNLLELCSSAPAGAPKGKGKLRPLGWEDPGKRRERMRAEGLMRKNQKKEDGYCNQEQAPEESLLLLTNN
ncbi:hypothetical protein FE257_001245 [Aspergillus nanangensis]|uniref:tRNA(Phe) 7-[(3-amino-3-carboxypropyl)-4-demethylwyosine(37)-N(4)]-methyltransferase n=1 Tax=Aspergillus nanangensis TaxID=2582783 RepID=A0AAD4GPU2_ASPNN|nr:hypothetical protein FE257_001245 [Aspergillus nanangensis]